MREIVEQQTYSGAVEFERKFQDDTTSSRLFRVKSPSTSNDFVLEMDRAVAASENKTLQPRKYRCDGRN